MTKDEHDAWYREDWMSDAQYRCYVFIADVVGGFHHLRGKPKPCGVGVEISLLDHRWSTYDGSCLTRLVFGAHASCIRVEISSSSPGRMKFTLHSRQREGGFHERHPTLSDAVGGFNDDKTND